jgi:hypothetical protein
MADVDQALGDSNLEGQAEHATISVPATIVATKEVSNLQID